MKQILNLNIPIADTWTSVALSNSPISQIMLRPRSDTATLKMSYETANQDLKYVTIRPGEAWVDSFIKHVPNKTIYLSCNETGVIEIEMTVMA